MSHQASVLLGTKGERVALCDVSVSAVLRDLLAEVTVSQTYRNDEKVNIEAVYTFPLPLDAVLLGLSVTIGTRTLVGTVVEKKAAETRYEDAIADGNSAVMLEQLEPGLYTMNVGNLLSDETAVIKITYAVMYRWAGDHLRMLIPTTTAPRYGKSHLAPHQEPEFSLTVENQFSLQIDVFGSLRDATFECPSHEVTLVSSSDKTMIALNSAKAVMDRDFILDVKAPQAAHSFALCGMDATAGEAADASDKRDGAAVLAAFQPLFPGLKQSRKLSLAVVIDCSGSMQGDSITQAKQAVVRILDGLQSTDRVSIVAFGNGTTTLFDCLQPCSEANLGRAREFVTGLQADMGGTEIGRALQAAYAATSGSEGADIFLVTDGEVSEWARVIGDAKKSGHRIFTVGVGHAVAEAFVRELAAGTGGECELVSPREGMADRVLRHFERMRAPRAKRVVVQWPMGACDVAPARFGSVFEGDTVSASARFDRPAVAGHVVMEIETESGQVFRQEVAIAQAPAPQSGSRVSAVARIAAAARMKELDRESALRTALRYQLASPWTNWLVVAERPESEKALEIPAVRKVPQTLAAGWGGVGAALSAQRVASIHDVTMASMSESMEGLLRKISSDEARLAQSAEQTLRGEEVRRQKFLSEFGDLSEKIDRLAHAVAMLTDHVRSASALMEEMHNEVEQFLVRVMADLEDLERRAEAMPLAPGDRAGRASGSVDWAPVTKARARLAMLRERLSHLQEGLMRLRHCRKLLREVEGQLRRGLGALTVSE